jgi:hypothetical protein
MEPVFPNGSIVPDADPLGSVESLDFIGDGRDSPRLIAVPFVGNNDRICNAPRVRRGVGEGGKARMFSNPRATTTRRKLAWLCRREASWTAVVLHRFRFALARVACQSSLAGFSTRVAKSASGLAHSKTLARAA